MNIAAIAQSLGITLTGDRNKDRETLLSAVRADASIFPTSSVTTAGGTMDTFENGSSAGYKSDWKSGVDSFTNERKYATRYKLQ
ncbi:MAG: hypothetical protein MZV64_27665 [Ignavibacteriales bacterium]|nr:hypothetical protein [Ignavibacteriales bacterium]